MAGTEALEMQHAPMTQQVNQVYSISNITTPNSKTDDNEYPLMNVLSPYSQVRSYALTQAFDFFSSNNAIDSSDSQSFEDICPHLDGKLDVSY